MIWGVFIFRKNGKDRKKRKGGHTAFDGEARVYVPFDGGLVLTEGFHLERVPFSGVGLRGSWDVECDGGFVRKRD